MTYLFAAAAAIGVAYGMFALHGRETSWRAAVKMLPALLLAGAAYLADAPALLMAALVLAAAGDGFLAFSGNRNFLAGLSAFLACHVAYIALFFAGQDPQFASGLAFSVGAAAILAVAVAGFRYLRPGLGAMRLPVAAYCGVIATMAIAAWARGPHLVLLAGVGLFMASDLALAAAKFRLAPDSPTQPAFARFVWFSYLAAQLLIAASFLFPSLAG